MTNGEILKLTDFGQSKNIIKQGKAITHTGTLPYMPYEIVNNKEHSFSADSWSLGVTIYHLVTKELKYKNNLLYLSAKNKERIQFEEKNIKKYPQLQIILDQVLKHVPEERWTMNDLREFLTSLNKDPYHWHPFD